MRYYMVIWRLSKDGKTYYGLDGNDGMIDASETHAEMVEKFRRYRNGNGVFHSIFFQPSIVQLTQEEAEELLKPYPFHFEAAGNVVGRVTYARIKRNDLAAEYWDRGEKPSFL